MVTQRVVPSIEEPWPGGPGEWGICMVLPCPSVPLGKHRHPAVGCVVFSNNELSSPSPSLCLGMKPHLLTVYSHSQCRKAGGRSLKWAAILKWLVSLKNKLKEAQRSHEIWQPNLKWWPSHEVGLWAESFSASGRNQLGRHTDLGLWHPDLWEKDFAIAVLGFLVSLIMLGRAVTCSLRAVFQTLFL